MLNSLEKRMLIYDVLDLFDGGGEPRPPPLLWIRYWVYGENVGEAEALLFKST